VGYGADPVAVLDRIRADRIPSVLGNHDAAVVDLHVDLAYFNTFARAAALWTRQALSAEHLHMLRTLPLTLEHHNFIIVHGSLDQPTEFNYIQTVRDAERSLACLHKNVCFVGHSHIPVGFLSNANHIDRIEYTFDTTIDLAGFDRCLINVGSVGQPRDEDPRPVAAIYDTDREVVTLERVAYDFDRAAGKILAAGLPRVLAERLRFGV
jgi:diadenosine tetraphosphatase ApaH/serine/threonine PP2A family protein phosphatase